MDISKSCPHKHHRIFGASVGAGTLFRSVTCYRLAALFLVSLECAPAHTGRVKSGPRWPSRRGTQEWAINDRDDSGLGVGFFPRLHGLVVLSAGRLSVLAPLTGLFMGVRATGQLLREHIGFVQPIRMACTHGNNDDKGDENHTHDWKGRLREGRQECIASACKITRAVPPASGSMPAIGGCVAHCGAVQFRNRTS